MKSNITPKIKEKVGKNLHNQKNHPLEIIKNKIYEYFDKKFNCTFKKYDDLNPIVSVEDNFDKLLIEKDHPSRRTSDTYYINKHQVLRTHTSAHQNNLMEIGIQKFLVTGDVYRKDEIDKCHYPVFHQTEGVCIVEKNENAEKSLKDTLSGLIEFLFPNCEYHFKADYFPFTNPSFEVEIKFNGEWLEILGCGIIQKQILKNCKIENSIGWAFGLGLERLAMILFNIPDIRYFWSTDERFLKQFKDGKIIEFKAYSKYPASERDISFWVSNTYCYNDFCEIIRENGGDLIENIILIDEFTHPKTNRESKCFRITYRSNDRSLIAEEIDDIQKTIRLSAEKKLKVEIR